MLACLPEPLSNAGRKKVDWSVRDKELCRRIALLQKDYQSLTAIDRAIDEHKWLLRHKVHFLIALKKAKQLTNKR